MEDAFGFDFTRVRIHADTEGDRLSRSLEARAFTTGSDIFFRQGAYKPESPSGQRLLAHELTHVVQQSGESMPVNSGNSFFSHTAQRVSEEAPHFVQRQADTSAETKEKIAKNKVTLQVSVKKQAPQTEEQKKKAPAAQEQVLPDEVVYDLVGLIQQIVNQNPNADIVQKKLDAVRAEYGLKALQVVGNATMGDSFTYDIRMKGPVEKPDTSSKDVAEGVKSMGSGGTLLDLALDYAIGYAVDKAVDGVTGLFKSNKKKSKSSSKKQSDQKTASQDKKAEANPGETQEESKPEQTEKKPKAEPEKKVPEAEQTTDPAADQSKQKGTKAQKPLDVNTKINRIDPVTVEVSVRANPKQGKTDPNSEQK
jgi:flagellar biosynthesis GTPase FlhF